MMEEIELRECLRTMRMCALMGLIAAGSLWDVEFVAKEGMRADENNTCRSR